MAGVKYTIQERMFLLRRYYEPNHDIKLLRKEFEQEYPNRGFPTCHTIYNMDRKFKRTGSVSDYRDLYYTIKILLCKKVTPFFPSTNLDSDFCTTPYVA